MSYSQRGSNSNWIDECDVYSHPCSSSSSSHRFSSFLHQRMNFSFHSPKSKDTVDGDIRDDMKASDGGGGSNV